MQALIGSENIVGYNHAALAHFVLFTYASVEGQRQSLLAYRYLTYVPTSCREWRRKREDTGDKEGGRERERGVKIM
jgi:hypothetical protein